MDAQIYLQEYKIVGLYVIYLHILLSFVLIVSDRRFFHGKVFRYYNLHVYARVVADLVRCWEFLREGFACLGNPLRPRNIFLFTVFIYFF